MCFLFIFSSYLYGVIILSGNYHLSDPAATSACLWVVGWVGCINMGNKETGSGELYLSDKIQTLK